MSDPTNTTDFAALRRRIRHAMLRDHVGLRKRLRSMENAAADGKPYDRNLARFTSQLEASIARRAARQNSVPAIRYDDDLPVSARRDELAAAIREHQVIVVCGETGSGKSTQLPKICLEAGRGVDGTIGHTQPRRIAARSVAARISKELGVSGTDLVGHKIRFNDATGPGTLVKVMTDGILLAETAGDRFLEQYDAIIIDEAHERSLNIDFLLGYVKRILPHRRDLKVIVTSATIDAERFAQHFGPDGETPAPIIEVSGRTYPVEVRYRPAESDGDTHRGDPDPDRALLAAVDEAAAIDSGDMLVFMPTERDIRDAARLLRGRRIPGDRPGSETEILPLYGRLSMAEQNRVFEMQPHRRIVIATNVAESSLTVPGIRYVIDTGTARISRFSARSKVQRLPIEPISRASADQRAGRCGRVGPGVCFRLYSQEDYETRERFTQPEIQRTNLASVILQTETLNLGSIDEFPFLDPPKTTAVREGYKTLFELGAIDESENLTEIGQRLSRMPVDPRIARMILAADSEPTPDTRHPTPSCLHDVLIVAAAMEVRDPRDRPVDKQQAADEAHKQFVHPESDFLTFLKIWDFHQRLKQDLSRSRLRRACRQSFLSFERLREWSDVFRQLRRLVEESGMKVGPRNLDLLAVEGKTVDARTAKREKRELTRFDRTAYDRFHQALLSGLLANVAYKADPDKHEYTGAGGQKLQLWPGSGLFEMKPQWIVAGELIETGRRYARTVARIRPEWIEPLAGHLVKRTYSDPQWSAASGSAVASEKVTLFGLPVVPRRQVRYGRIDAVRSRWMFIQHGLVEGEIETRAPFFIHNQQLLEEVEALQARSRRSDLLLGEDARYDFYDRRIPAEVVDLPSCDKWRKQAERSAPRILFMSKGDLLRADADAVDDAAFPATMDVGTMCVALDYHLEPGAEEDGVTLTVPRAAVSQLDRRRLGWLVPGLLEEKVAALIRTLPKAKRRMFVPVPDTARDAVSRLEFGRGDVLESLVAALKTISDEPLSPDDFDADALPNHLRLNIRVVDDAGRAVAKSRDLAELRREVGTDDAAGLVGVNDPRFNRDGIVAWDFGDLPAAVHLNSGGVAMQAYPSLADAGDSVSLRLADTPQRAAIDTRAGVRRLFVLTNRRAIKAHVDNLPRLNELTLQSASIAGFDLRRQLTDLIGDRALFADAASPPRTAAAFSELSKLARNRISLAAQDAAAVVPNLFAARSRARKTVRSGNAPQWQYAIQDVESQLEGLFGPACLTGVHWNWLCQVPRYCEAIVHRLEKLPGGGLARDRKLHAELEPHQLRFIERRRSHKEQGIHDPHLEHFRWMLEEFRVSLFAQKLGTAVSVSPQRLDAQWEKVAPG